MAFDVNQESLDSAREEATAVIRATRSIELDERRYQWLYQSNPDGDAVLWSVRKRETGEMVGFTVGLPRRVMIGDKIGMAWNGADFSVLPKFRTLGVSLKLRRAAKTAIDNGAVDLLYSHPNSRMQVIHERVGHFRVGQMLRYAKPLRIAEKLPKVVPAWASRLLDSTVTRAITWSPRESLRKSHSELNVLHDVVFDSRFDNLFDDVHCDRKFVGVRDAAYLDWRYRQYPSQKFHLIEATQSGRLEGYLVFTFKDRMLSVLDVFGTSNNVHLDLLSEAVRIARVEGVASVSMNLLEKSDLIPILQRLGFRARSDPSNMFAYTSDPGLQTALSDPSQWLIHVGDRDV